VTKVSVFGQDTEVKKDLKKIEFIRYLNTCLSFLSFHEGTSTPSIYENLVLLEREYGEGLDLIWAYNDDPNMGTLYLGHWNDGVV
jgi:hypothetical protein